MDGCGLFEHELSPRVDDCYHGWSTHLMWCLRGARPAVSIPPTPEKSRGSIASHDNRRRCAWRAHNNSTHHHHHHHHNASVCSQTPHARSSSKVKNLNAYIDIVCHSFIWHWFDSDPRLLCSRSGYYFWTHNGSSVSLIPLATETKPHIGPNNFNSVFICISITAERDKRTWPTE